MDNRSLWIITNGLAGNISQANGLVKYLPWQGQHLSLPIPNWQRYLTMKFISNHFISLEKLPQRFPDIVVGCGRHSIPYLLSLKKRCGDSIKTVYILDPRINSSHFDVVISKSMDSVRGDNVIKTFGSMHALSKELLEEKAISLKKKRQLSGPYLFIAIGGGSITSRYAFTARRCETLVKKITAVANEFEGTVLVSPTRRTGVSNIAMLKASLGSIDNLYLDEQMDIDTYHGMLGLADYCLVSTDSVNLLTEACFTQKPVYYYLLPEFTHSKKLQRFLGEMSEKQYIKKFNHCFDSWSYPAMNEAKRASRLLLETLDL